MRHVSSNPNVGRLAISRAWQRYLRRRRIAKAYDMAKEIAAQLATLAPTNNQLQLVDVGCGNGFIGHHLQALMSARVCGVDVQRSLQAEIEFRHFDGLSIPLQSSSQDAALMCYVLHHCEDPAGLLTDVHRILRSAGRIVIYEDLPRTAFDQLQCARHAWSWRSRSPACTFMQSSAWRGLLNQLGFTTITERHLSRLRDCNNPVERWLYVGEKR
ncbi:MAG: methyltransferase domain-containing protein [Deltaproteobacteria bacterium]|nr:methyltransferase domain-containing protein [Deltaproteobacteria bacterium]